MFPTIYLIIILIFVQGKASNLKIDGTHHQAEVDHLPNRGGVPWGALLNSSEGGCMNSATNVFTFPFTIHQSGRRKKACNCKMEYIISPHFEKDLHNDGHDREAFLVATREIQEGEELLWSYSITQSYRSVASEPAQGPDSQESPPMRALLKAAAPKLPNFPKKPSTQALPQHQSVASEPAQGPDSPECPHKRVLLKPCSPQRRCQGCLCVNPCTTLKHCLTPQLHLKKRVSMSKQLSS